MKSLRLMPIAATLALLMAATAQAQAKAAPAGRSSAPDIARADFGRANQVASPRHDALLGVSCPRVGSCVAVGDHGPAQNASRTLAEAWNGTRWRIMRTPSPASAASQLDAVSCTSISRCMAVGFSNNSAAVRLPLTEELDGTHWRILSAPRPAAAMSMALHDVSCLRATSCLAVGSYDNSSGASIPVAERWNGTRWRLLTPSLPAGATSAGLGGVSCVNATGSRHARRSGPARPAVPRCVAVGFRSTSSSNGFPLAEKWNGRTWTVLMTPNPPATGIPFAEMISVSCAGPLTCMAVGESISGPVPFSEIWSSGKWKLLPTPFPALAVGANLDAVSCTGASSCMASGSSVTHVSQSPLAERWNGTRWRLLAPPEPPAATTALLDGVSCATASTCIAAGTYLLGVNSNLSLADRWNGHHWRLLKTPNS